MQTEQAPCLHLQSVIGAFLIQNIMSKGWENHEPSPIEFMHGKLMDEFHKWRIARTESINVKINGMEFNRIVVEAKKATYEKYKVLGLDKAVLKSVLNAI